MVVCQIHMLHRLADEGPQIQRLIGSLVIQYEVELLHLSLLLDEEQAAKELLGDGERSLPYHGLSDL